MSDAPVFTQAEVEEFGELLDIGRLLIERITHDAVDDPAYWAEISRFQDRRKAFIELIRDRLEPHLPIGEK